MKHLYQNIRLYFVSAIYSYRALYAWQRWDSYFSAKIIYPLSQMFLFFFMGRLAGVDNPLFIVIGNILLMPAVNGVQGVSLTISSERDFRTLPYLIACPAPRGLLFMGRSLVHIIDGLLSTTAALILGVLVFHVDLSNANLPLTFLCILIISITSTGLGLLLGSLSLRTREAWTITSVAYLALMVFTGANFPVRVLPEFLQWISMSLPLTRGIAAARIAIAGGNWQSIQHLLVGEILIGIAYILMGYLIFTWFEKISLTDGQIETV
jgi:ABC-2 type transport system permease protein